MSWRDLLREMDPTAQQWHLQHCRKFGFHPPLDGQRLVAARLMDLVV